jgi:glycosidase
VLLLAALLACDSDPSDLPPPDRAGVVYEVYVRSFQDSDGDGVGDLQGLRSRLPYLASLGTETLWLMPVMPAMGPAGYDVTDFDGITAPYGDEDDLDALVADAHALGIEVLLDLPLNHTGSAHPWFADALAGDRDRYVFGDTRWSEERWFPAGDGSYYYGFFGKDLPDLDWTNGAVRDEMLGVFDAWLGSADGYRLDAVITYVEEEGRITDTDGTHALLAELHERAGGATLLAEASMATPEESLRYLGDAGAPEADLVLDFPRHDALIEAFTTGDAGALRSVVREEGDDALRMAPFLGSHDVTRLPERLPDAEARRAAMVALFLLPGRPVLYYGDELDLPEADDTCLGQDYCMRAPMPWTSGHAAGFTEGTPWFTPHASFEEGVNVADAEADPDSLLTLVKALGALRSESEAVRSGDLRWLGHDDRVLAFERRSAGEVVSVRVNVTGSTVGDLGPWGYSVARDGLEAL